MNIEDIAREAIESLKNLSIDELEAICKEFGHTPIRKEYQWQQDMCVLNISLLDQASIMDSKVMCAQNDESYDSCDEYADAA